MVICGSLLSVFNVDCVSRLSSGNSLCTMDGNNVTSDQIIAELVDMGFDILDIAEALKAVGPSLDNAIEFILNDSHRNNRGASTSSICITNNKILGKRATSSLQSSAKLRQQNITEHLKLASGTKRSKTRDLCNASVSNTNFLTGHVEEPEDSSIMDTGSYLCPETPMVPSYCKDEEIIGFDCEQKVNNLLHKHFGYSSLKGFQKEALAAWLAHQDCLILAATGSGIHSCTLYAVVYLCPLNKDILHFSRKFPFCRKIIMLSGSSIVIWEGGGGYLTIN